MAQLKELTDKTCTIDTDAFLSHILPIAANNIDRVFCRLASGAAYSGTRWASFPADGYIKKAAHLYAPFVRVANEILDACRAEPGIAVELETLCWRIQNLPGRDDVPSTALDDEDNEDGDEDEDNDTSLIRLRPGVVASLSDDAEADAIGANEVEILKHVCDLGENTQIPRTQHEELSQKLSRWWLRVHVPVEVQYEDSEEETWAGVDRLCGYMKSVLAEQLDRRFAVGLLVCKDKLTVWLCDRSGLIGTRVPIDIHKEPKKFIHVMMGLSCLEPARLGWDPTMKIVCKGKDGVEYRASTSAQVTINDFGRTAYETKWAIFVPKEDGSAAGEWYTTVRILSIERAAMMTGRATLIWVVTKAGDGKRFVLKQTWCPDYAYTEAEFRALAPPDSNLCQIVRSVDVGAGDIDDQASAAAVVDTKYYVRRGLPGASDSDSAPPAKKLRLGEEPGSPAVVLVIVDPATEDTTGEKGSESVRRGRFRFTNRVLTRTLMSTYGWPVKFFRDHRELVETIRDAVKGHQDLWFGGVLHRDVSVGNILICPEDNGDRKTRGRLIDLDYSKRTSDKPGDPDESSSALDEDRLTQSAARLVEFVKGIEGIDLDQRAAHSLVLRYPGPVKVALKYIDVVLRIYPRLQGISRPLSEEDLRLYDVVRAPPRENNHTRTPETIGTKAFMSAEVLTNQPNWPTIEKCREKWVNGYIFHSAIHDLESFFWVLVYLCLTRAGPGGEHRDPPEDPKTCAQLDNVVSCLFNSDNDMVIARNKHDLFQSLEDLQGYIIPHFHPYFQCLSDLVLDWWNALQLAYRTYDALTPGFIHQQVLDVLDNAMKNLPDPVPSKEMDREDDRRMKDLDSIETMSSGQSTSTPSRKIQTVFTPVTAQLVQADKQVKIPFLEA
ncbi:hypothetical protein DENSPDRAFT_828628 [Dentipellis sp. KUC8613]|nr:hypothetical protein DENSPDRAFT_828628 [Dentipellis sp. KUC8613]